PAAFSGETVGTGSGGVSSRSVSVFVAVWLVVAICSPLPEISDCIRQARHAIQGGPWPSVESVQQHGCKRKRKKGGSALASSEDAGDRLDFRSAGGERVGEEKHRNRQSADDGESVLRVVRNVGHLMSPL